MTDADEELASFIEAVADDNESTGDPFPWSETTTRLNSNGSSFAEWNASRQRDRREWEVAEWGIDEE